MMNIGVHIIIAYGLDWLIGDPEFLPHPVRWIGRYAAWLESVSRRWISNERAAGCVTVVMVVTTSGACVLGFMECAGAIWPFGKDIVMIWVLYTALATRDLSRHAMRVKDHLDHEDLAGARHAVSMIVGRDTSAMDAPAVARAAVESVGENMVDGVTAPLMVMLVFGPVGVIMYKAVSTLDSMFGYRNQRYHLFGWCAARLDDLLTFIPARLTMPCAALAALISGNDFRGVISVTLRDWKLHESPNSAWGEAAIAGGIGAKIGGYAVYAGKTSEMVM
jgi:adenosylcobinamide-phosphate synthase